MSIFIYDYTFEGLLTCIFDAYFRKTFPDLLLKEGEPLPLFYDETFHVSTDERKAMRVCAGWKRKYPTMPCPPSPIAGCRSCRK